MLCIHPTHFPNYIWKEDLFFCLLATLFHLFASRIKSIIYDRSLWRSSVYISPSSAQSDVLYRGQWILDQLFNIQIFVVDSRPLMHKYYNSNIMLMDDSPFDSFIFTCHANRVESYMCSKGTNKCMQLD